MSIILLTIHICIFRMLMEKFQERQGKLELDQLCHLSLEQVVEDIQDLELVSLGLEFMELMGE